MRGGISTWVRSCPLYKGKRMTPENFIYWLNGFLEIAKPTTINEEQIQEIKNHIALVLEKKTPVVQNNVKFFNRDLNLPSTTGIPFNGYTPYPSGPQSDGLVVYKGTQASC